MSEKKVLVFGATGNVGGATARALLADGWQVRGVTRNPESTAALALASLGVEVVKADMDDRASLDKAFSGIKKVLSVQNWMKSGVEGEVRQGKLVADAAKAAGVDHLVFSSAGTGKPGSGIPHFDNKLEVVNDMRSLDLPFTSLRPAPFMELLTEKEFFPLLASWGTEPGVIGWDTPKPWVAVQDIGRAIAIIFNNPDSWIGKDFELYGDAKTMRQCQEIFKKVDGKKPGRLPLPIGLFKKMAGSELVDMWYWMVRYAQDHTIDDLNDVVRESNTSFPGMLDLESWLRIKRGQPVAKSV